MYKRLDHGYLSTSYHASVKGLFDVAFCNEATVGGDYIRCPCSKCKNKPYKAKCNVELHLLQNSFTSNYTTWWAHGERNMISQHEEESSNQMQDPMEDDDDDDDDDDVNGCTQILMDLLHWKSKYNISEATYNHILPIIKRMLPKATLKRPPTGVELYARLHTKQSTQEYITPKGAKVQEAYESAMVAKFIDDTSCHLLLDNETWCDVSGGVKNGRIYGFRSVSDPTSFLEGTSSTITSQEFPIMALYIQSFLSWYCTHKVSYHGIVLTKFLYHSIALTKFHIMALYVRLSMNVYETRCVGKWMLKLQKWKLNINKYVRKWMPKLQQ
uniref:Transposase-associated domain-containing protein n=1 Tax=Lactuca sativa TaxID=4236 RepID=A0A9R1W1R2_LACSA|nr:hypothetical protein LSAT_V11C300144130 [Lactuca sativa]